MRVLVTGGAGFIGSHVVDALLAQGHEVSVLDNLSSGRRENVPAGVKLYEIDLRDRAATARAVLDFRPGAVSHQAAQASVAISVRDPHLDADVNVLGGLNLLDACTASGVAVERVVFASTGGAIYGEVPDPERASESTLPAPQSPYAIHKHTFEQLLGAYGRYRDLGSTVLRYANVYGPRQDPHGEAGVVAIFFDKARAGQPLRVNARQRPGDDGCVRDYVFVTDVARANVLALSGSLKERLLNVASGIGTTTRELATTILASVGDGKPLEFAPTRAGDLERSVLDPTLVERYLGKLVPLADGLRQTHDFYASRGA
ncbi:MAG TPA: NAD-dependent epimerase/dehydratase family protein [Polyangiaceae bacterium]|nr:NAD-dependent epimerase/dehydratase family protein [Polyangiaceae bacterium]